MDLYLYQQDCLNWSVQAGTERQCGKDLQFKTVTFDQAREYYAFTIGSRASN